MPAFLSDAARRDGHRLATRQVAGPPFLRERDVRRRVRNLDRAFARLFQNLRDELAREGRGRVPAGGREWLLENDFVVAETLEELEGALPSQFLRRLPGLRHPEGERGSVRIEVLARAIARRDPGRIELEEVALFLRGYQEVRSLRIAELWALPAFLRLVLLEELLERFQKEGESVEVGSYILSLRTLASEDWRGIVEDLSRIDDILSEDPSGVYSTMDFRTRDRYRKVVEKVAAQGKLEEDVVARHALDLARARASEEREGHVGYYLVDEGADPLYRGLGIPVPVGAVPSTRRKSLGRVYFGSIAALTVILLFIVGMVADPGWARTALVLIAILPALGTAVALVNRVSGQMAYPRTLPRIDVRKGIPERFRTLVAVPSLLGSRDDIIELLHTLEINYQANPDPALTFALVTDFSDSPTRNAEEDESLLDAARSGIRALNELYSDDGAGPFLILHRPRRWNPAEGVWMGWERKRGKLSELNQLLLGRPSELWVAEGDAARLEGVPFVLTLDADTRMPRDAAARLVGTLAHPLNRPEVGAGGKIRRGYSVLQPRIEVLPEPDGGTLFSRVSGGVQGLDLYAHAAFDVYQDLFDEGIFAGKGIYDVHAFESSLAGRTPENSLLSHDLFEGAHGRAGLVADLILLEDFPAHLLAHARRQHRWVRGDWQILPWLLPRVPGENGTRLRNPLGPLSRWKILDNLRRSLQPLATTLLFVVGWIAIPDHAFLWTLAIAGVVGFPFLTGSLDAVFRFLRRLPRRADVEAEQRALVRALGRWVLDLAFLPFEAWNQTDAVVRALHRMTSSRKGLLEWTSAAVTARSLGMAGSFGRTLAEMRSGPLVAVGSASAVLLASGSLPSPAIPLLVLWLLSPLVAHQISRRRGLRTRSTGEYPVQEARSLARRVWGYYERFQVPEHHWLAPDHFQEDPGAEVAHRTSPTNIGMAMVSAVTARDLNFIGIPRFITGIRNTVDGMSRLSRYRGHFLNWYDTLDLEPLHPLYVSTVDSGNLAAALLVTREALLEGRSAPAWSMDRMEGLVDTARVVTQLLEEMRSDGAAQALRVDVDARIAWMERSFSRARASGIMACLEVLEELRDSELPEIERHFLHIDEVMEDTPLPEGWGPVHAWLGHFRADVESVLDDLILFVPWTAPRFRTLPVSRDLCRELLDGRVDLPSLPELRAAMEGAIRGPSSDGSEALDGLNDVLKSSAETLGVLLDDIERLSTVLGDWFREMDFTFLYDRRRKLFRIGFSVSGGELDANHYDLLASEARIASAIAIAKGDVPPAHWLHLGRPFTWTGRGPVLVSWAGTMFEYLMPHLFLHTPPETILDEACSRAVEVQQEYGKKLRIPWGISESGYHVLSPEGHYQYRAFGVPSLGLRRKAGNRLVVAPYASLMAVSFAPGEVHRNVDLIRRLGGIGPWGPYEALDFGREGEWKYEPRVVRSYMSHHHGMILTALGNHLTGGRIVQRFHRDARIGTVEPYLFERIPWRRALERKWVDRSIPLLSGRGGVGIRSWSPPVDRIPPPAHHLASGDFVVALGPDGRGGSRWKDWAVVRGGVAAGLPTGGPDVVLLERSSRETWRPMPDPWALPDDDQQIIFEPHRAEYMRKSRSIRTRMDVLLPPTPGVEVRQLTISNESPRPRHLRLAVSVELALAPISDDLRHPAFQKLFVRAEALRGGEGLLFERLARSPDEVPPILLVALLGPDGLLPDLRWGTSRDAFLGRTGNPERPAALLDPTRLDSPSEPHHPLDPMASAVLDLDLPPWGDLQLTFLMSVGPDRESVIRNAAELRSPGRREWARIQARARAEGELLRLGAEAEDPAIWSELLANILRPRAMRVPGGSIAGKADVRQSTLWRWGISGDIPFILIEEDVDRTPGILSELFRAQRWWKARGHPVDVVIAGRGVSGYQDLLRDQIRVVLSDLGAEELLGRTGGVHLVRMEELGPEEWDLLQMLAAFTIDPQVSSLDEQIRWARPTRARLPRLALGSAEVRDRGGAPNLPEELTFAQPPRGGRAVGEVPSAYGSFDPGTGDYTIQLGPGETTPAPWVNLVARDDIGFLVTESGGSFTWIKDAGEFRLTPWQNDPVLGIRGEVLYLRDEEDGGVWTTTPGPLGMRRTHSTRHGWGRTRIQTTARDLVEEITWSLHPELPVKVIRLRLENRGARSRRISASFFADWVLGPHPALTSGRLQVVFDSSRSAVLARNPFSMRFADRFAFLATDGVPEGMCTDGEEFLGAAGPLDRVPAGMRSILPGERETPDGQPCGVLRRELRLGPGESGEVSFFLGAVEGSEALDEVLSALRSGGKAESPPDEVEASRWRDYLGRVKVRTPDAELDYLMNGWLPYQTVVSRLRGRTGFYQSGGAYGFRDQLQDVYTLLPLDSSLAVQQLERAARRQFREGDVLHWWHPETDRGVRTRCSDDLLWLPWVLAQTVSWTGDRSVLERTAPWLLGDPLPEGIHERYDLFEVSEDEGTLWEHAIRAVEHCASLRSPRGLPLIGTGDWNDGMDRVGIEGKGESIWLGWFLIDTCKLLIPLARERGEESLVTRLERWSREVREAIESHGWDGAWYRRAFFDDGSPLGSREAREARIDSIAQSWGIISGAADPDRARIAMDSAWRELVREEDGVILLLTPPFTGDGPDPGYIAAYPPGVRENGGQYTHAAAWLLRGFARIGDGDRAGSLLRTLLPTRHASGEGTHRYRVEPYVIAADVYGADPHVGRGGWTWYTGSAGWIWRVALEDILGVKREGDHLRILPCIPSTWDGFQVELTLPEGIQLSIRVRNPHGVTTGIAECRLDGIDVDPSAIPLGPQELGEVPDGEDGVARGSHQIEVVMGPVQS
jgi:cyclic beta-1,2-glucan synthetase